MADDVKAACGDCKFWERWGSEYGGCRRMPPTLVHFTVYGRQREHDRIEVTMDTTNKPIWPNTAQDDWCGEFIAR